MTSPNLRDRLQGCYVAVPTLFHDHDLSVNVEGIKTYVRYLVEGGLRTGHAVLLAGGAAGDFSTMTFDERLLVAETVVEAAQGQIPVGVGGQTTSTLELVRLVKAASRLGADFVQVSPPFYFSHTEDDFLEYVRAAAEASDIGLVIYNTFWNGFAASAATVERLADIPTVAALKWATPDLAMMTFEKVVATYADRFTIIDNQMRFVVSHILGARAIELHVAAYWPQFGVRMWDLLEAGSYIEAQREMVRVALPFMSLWSEMESYTAGDGYLDKLCLELVGLPSSRCRPPTRDVRQRYRERARQMLIEAGVPGIRSAA